MSHTGSDIIRQDGGRVLHRLPGAAATGARGATGLPLHCALAAALAVLALAPAAPGHAAVPEPRTLAAADSLAGEELPPLGTGTSWMIGSTLLDQGDAPGALPYLRQAWRLSGGEPDIGEAYLTALVAVGMHAEALEVLDSLLAKAPADERLLTARVRLLAALERHPEALAALEELKGSGAESTPDLLLLEAELLVADQRPEEALLVYRRALDALPERRERLYLVMAPLVERTATAAELADFWSEAAAAVPGSRPLQAGRLQQLVRSGRIDEALAAARELDARPEGSTGPGPAWEVELAEILTREGKIPRAIEVLRDRRERGLHDPETALWLGRLLLSRGEAAAAMPLLEEVSQASPADGTADYFLGEALLEAGDLEKAEARLREAARREPQRPEFEVALLRTLMMRHGTALQALEGAPAAADTGAGTPRGQVREVARRAGALLSPEDHRGHLLLGLAWRAAGDPAAAVPHLELAAAGEQTFKPALLQLALCLDRIEEHARALAALEKLHQRLPDDAEVANSLGYYLADRNQDLPRAERLIRQALEAEPDNGAYIDSLGWVLFRLGRHQEAFDRLVEAANAVPDDPIVLEHLGLALVALDRPAEALRTLRRARAVGGGGDRLLQTIRALEAAGTTAAGDAPRVR